MNRLAGLLGLVFINIHSLWAVEVQAIKDIKNEVILDSSVSDTWYVTLDRVNPALFSKRILEEKDSAKWVKTRVPGSILTEPRVQSAFYLDHKVSAAAYLRGLFTLSEPAGYEEKIKTAWFKKEIVLPRVIKNNLSLRLGQTSDRDIVFFNGVEIGAWGNFNHEKPQGYDRIALYDIPSYLLKPGKKNVILIKLQNYFLDQLGIYQNYTAIGATSTLWSNLWHGEYLKIILLICYLTAGIYFLFLFLRRGQDLDYLFYGLFTLTLVAYQFLRTQLKYEMGIDFFYMKKVEYLLLALLFTFITHFCRHFFSMKYSWFLKVLDACYAITFIIILLHPSVRLYNFVVQNFFQYAYLATIVFFIGTVIYFAVKKNKDAIAVSGGALVMVACVLLDTGTNNGWWNIPRLAGYGFIFFVMGLAAVLANKFVRLNKDVEELNTNLERKVEERTEELQKTLNEVQALKEHQDGDYFLTSLLIKPLGVNRAEAENIDIQFFIQQKKQFKFKKWQAEIGGDLCVSHNIELMGKKYTVFMNGDAMGKSIQGAGGALVYGVVFNSVVARTQLSKAAQQRYPEQWLKDAFHELQAIFVNFNGSMLVSMVMGLVDNETGFLYYFNAEHPYTVLYRDQRAGFLEDEIVLRKIGIENIEHALLIHTFQLLPGDVIILGSDGRDDLLMGTDEQGLRMINEDENLFLRQLEAADADLAMVADKLKEMGQVTDDLSLLRLSYKEGQAGRGPEISDHDLEEYEKLLKSSRQHYKLAEYQQAAALAEKANQLYPSAEPLLLQVKCQLLLEDFKSASGLAEKGIHDYPGFNELSYLAARAYKGLNRLQRAADHGERARLREPENVNNLVNLADIYRLLKMKERAEMIIKKAEAIDAANNNLVRLKNAMQ